MKIVVLSGSPRNELSVTMHYVKYLENKFSQHEFKILNIYDAIKKLENNAEFMEQTMNEIKYSDGIIWAFPVYIYTVHSHYMRFIELIFERNAKEVFKGKYTVALTTSIHFFDHTAINYIHSICDDLDMNYVDYFSIHMRDLLNKDIRINLVQFFENYLDTINQQLTTFKSYNQVNYTPIDYIPEASHEQIDHLGKKIVVITDSLKNKNVKYMIEKFSRLFNGNIELINLEEADIKGPCLGCIKCGYNHECVYKDKDDYINIYNNKLKTADILVFAGAICYRYLSSTWKNFFDRSFFHNHTPSLIGKQVGIILSGPLAQIPNLRQILETYVQWNGSNLVGFVTDESDKSSDIDERLYTLSYKLIHLSMSGYHKPSTFLGVAAKKVFRDEIWNTKGFPFVADHRSYKKLKMYDFPQKKYKIRLVNFILTLLMKFPAIRKRMYSDQSKKLIPLKRIIEMTRDAQIYVKI